jgi:hypothetical protein
MNYRMRTSDRYFFCLELSLPEVRFLVVSKNG